MSFHNKHCQLQCEQDTEKLPDLICKTTPAPCEACDLQTKGESISQTIAPPEHKWTAANPGAPSSLKDWKHTNHSRLIIVVEFVIPIRRKLRTVWSILTIAIHNIPSNISYCTMYRLRIHKIYSNDTKQKHSICIELCPHVI